MAQIDNVTGTAFVVAEFRAEENNELAALPGLCSRTVPRRGYEDGRRPCGRSFPPARDLVRIRTKYLDDVLEAQIRSRVRQVVILGAGLDTRAVRMSAPGVTFFEIDDPATLNLKRARYRERDIEQVVTFIPGNYVTNGVIHLLDRHGFDFSLPTYFIWEGNTMYLPLDRARHVLAELEQHVAQFRVSFDYMAEAVVSRTTGDPGITRFVESFAAMGAPWLSGIRDVRSLASELGLTLVDNVTTAALHQKYWAGRSMSSPIFNFYSVCTMGSDRGASRSDAS